MLELTKAQLATTLSALEGEERNPNSKETALACMSKYARVLGISVDCILEAAQPLLDGTIDADEFIVRLRTPRKVDRKPRAKREGPTKESAMIDMLKLPEGVTIAQLMDATGWQKHSCFGWLATVKKKHGLVINSEKPEGSDRVYRLA